MTAGSTARILKGPLGFQVARFGLPLALGMGLQTSFNLVDAYVISRLGDEVRGPALGAIGICDQLAALGTIVSYGSSVATAAIVSRRVGAGDEKGTRHIAFQSLLVVLLLGCIFGALGILGADLLMRDIVSAKGRVAVLGAQYLQVIMGGSITIFLLLHLTTLQRALGSSKTPVSMLIAANALNFVLSILLVYGPGEAPPVFAWGPPIASALGLPRMELLGAAWSTVIARSVVLVPLVVILVQRFGLFRRDSRAPPEAASLRLIWKLGWPSSAQLVVRILAMLVVHSLVARAYTNATDQSATTALGIVFRLETMALFMGLGWGSAAQTFMGQNLGAQQVERAKLSGWYAGLFNVFTMGALAAAYQVWGPEIVRFFDDDPRVVATALGYIHWVSLSYLGLGLGIVLGAAIQGAGATRLALRLDAAVVVLLQLPLCLWVVLSGQGSMRLWQVVGFTYVTFAVVYAWSYRKGTYLRAQLV